MAPGKIALLTDSCADLSRELAEENRIYTVPLRIRCGDREFRDGVDICAGDIYRLLRSGELPPTFYCYGTRDPFYDQFLANADAAEEAGVSVERLQLDGMPHGFGAGGGRIPAYDQWLSEIFANN